MREIGGVPLQNNLSDNSIVWNVTPMSEAKKFVRSHGMNEFTLHTDASYETNPPRYVGLFVVREDLNGGGLTLASDSKKILQHLSPQSLEILKSKHHFKVPPEYRKSVDEISGAILFNGIIRYRREIILNPSDKVIIALNEFDNLARNMQKTIVLRTNMLLILDNHRFLHGGHKYSMTNDTS